MRDAACWDQTPDRGPPGTRRAEAARAKTWADVLDSLAFGPFHMGERDSGRARGSRDGGTVYRLSVIRSASSVEVLSRNSSY